MSSGKEFGYELFGSMNFDVKGSSIPLDLKYKISVMGETLYLSADLTTDWTDALGIKSLTVRTLLSISSLSIPNMISSSVKSNWGLK